MGAYWEYKLEVEPTEEHLNELGALGWELVGVINGTSGRIQDAAGMISTTVTLIFKRRKPGTTSHLHLQDIIGIQDRQIAEDDDR